jgi:hypothetical protein
MVFAEGVGAGVLAALLLLATVRLLAQTYRAFERRPDEPDPAVGTAGCRPGASQQR